MTDITLLGHSAALLSNGGSQLLIDPGVFSDLDALSDATAVLVTHAHPDHLVADLMQRYAGEVWAPQDVAASLSGNAAHPERIHAIQPGESAEVAGFHVAALGGLHAVIHPDLPRISNNAYLIEGSWLFPGDSFTIPADPGAVQYLFAAVSAPWLKLAETIDFARQFPQACVIPVHDAILSDAGRTLVDNVMRAGLPGRDYRRLSVGAATTV